MRAECRFMTMNKLKLPLLGLVLLLPFFLVLCPVSLRAEDFTIVIFPDTQYLVSGKVDAWKGMCDWVIANKQAFNTKAVLSVGDITDTGGEADFKVAAQGFARIEQKGIPCVPIIGNHDYDLTPRDRAVTHYDAVFGPDYFKGKAYYGGNLGGSNANYWVKLQVGKRMFLVVCLELFPRQSAVDWASNVIDSMPDAEVVVLTHGYLNPDARRTARTDRYGPATYGLTDGSSGEDLWENLIRKKANIRAVLCGHQINGANVAVSQGIGDGGNLVQQIFINYQYALGAWVGILNFHDADGSVELSAYNTDKAYGPGIDQRYPKQDIEWKPIIELQ